MIKTEGLQTKMEKEQEIKKKSDLTCLCPVKKQDSSASSWTLWQNMETEQEIILLLQF